MQGVYCGEKCIFDLSQLWNKEKILSPLEESNVRPLDITLWCSTTEPQRLYGEQGPLWSHICSYTTLVLYTARIGNVADPSSYYAGHIFFVPHLWQDKKTSLFLYQALNLSSSLFYLQYILGSSFQFLSRPSFQTKQYKAISNDRKN